MQRRKVEYLPHVHSSFSHFHFISMKRIAYENSVLLLFLLILLGVTALVPSTCIIHLVIITAVAAS